MDPIATAGGVIDVWKNRVEVCVGFHQVRRRRWSPRIGVHVTFTFTPSPRLLLGNMLQFEVWGRPAFVAGKHPAHYDA